MSLRHYGPASLWLIASSVMPPIGMLVLLSQVARLAPWLQSHGPTGAIFAATLFSLLGGLAIVPTFSFAIVCGWAFGSVWGSAVGMTAVLGATLIGNLVGRACAAGVPVLLSRRPRLAAVVHALVHASPSRTFTLITLLRIPVIAPFAIVNALLAMLHTRMRLLLPATLLGMLPRTLAGAWFGATLSKIDFASLRRQPENFSLLLASILALAAALAVITWVTQRTLSTLIAESNRPAPSTHATAPTQASTHS